MIAIFAAEGVEIGAVRARMQEVVQLTEPWAVYSGSLAGGPVVLVETGVGKVAAGAAVAWAAERYHPEAAFWVGVAGALDPSLVRSTVLVARDAVQWDVDLSVFGRAAGELDTGERYIPADEALSELLLKAAGVLGYTPLFGRVVSGDQFVAQGKLADNLRAEHRAVAVDMEGAAALWTARRLSLPMALLRVITDHADTSAPGAFVRFLDEASEHMAELLEQALRHRS